MFKLDLEKAEKAEIKLPTSSRSQRKQESSRKTSTSALLTMPRPLTVWITTNHEIFQEMGISDHLTSFLRNLYAGQEATVRTGHGTMGWFKIGKGVQQGCILSPCLFNLYAEWSESFSVVFCSLQPHGLYSPRNSPGQNPGVGSFSLLQGIFPTQRSNSGLPHCRNILQQLSHKGSPYAEYIMQNAGLDETQAGIKIAGRNINNFRYADDTTLRTESEEELKTSWWKWKSWLKTEQSKSEDHGIRSHHFIANTWGKQWNQWETLFSWAPKSLQMKLKDACFLEEKQWPT